MWVGQGEIICSLSHFLNYYLMVIVYLRLLYLFSWYIMYIPAMYTSLHIYQYSTLYYVSLFLIFCFLLDFKHVHSFIGDNFLISPLIVSNQLDLSVQVHVDDFCIVWSNICLIQLIEMVYMYRYIFPRLAEQSRLIKSF